MVILLFCLAFQVGALVYSTGEIPADLRVRPNISATLFDFLDARCSRRHPEDPNFLFLKSVFNASEVHSVLHHLDLPEQQEDDRYDIETTHNVWRVEHELESAYPEIFSKARRLIWEAVLFFAKLPDARAARDLLALPLTHSAGQSRPLAALRDATAARHYEVEFISYEAPSAHFEEHVDTESFITMVLMLTDPRSYSGGLFTLMEDPQPHELRCPATLPFVTLMEGPRHDRVCSAMLELKFGARSTGTRAALGCEEAVVTPHDTDADKKNAFEVGDVVLFRGEEFQHYVSQLTSGHRAVLQVEFREDEKEATRSA